MLAPTIERMADEFAATATVAKRDVDEHPQIAQQYKITALPTVAIFVDGEEVERRQGVVRRDALSHKLARWTSDERVARQGNRLSKIP